MCPNSNDGHLASTLTWSQWKWSHSVFICALLIVSSALAGDAEFQFPQDVRTNLVSKDGNNLLNPEFLPFLNDCNSVNTTNRVLCAVYFDMVYNVYEYGGNVSHVKAEIRRANHALENSGKEFCSLFPTEITQALKSDKRPFLDVNHINLTALFTISDYCTINCLTVQDATLQVAIKPICKSISGGCKWILKQNRNALPAAPKITENISTKLPEKTLAIVSATPKYHNENGKAKSNSNNNLDTAATDVNAEKLVIGDLKPSENVDQTSKLSPPLNLSSNHKLKEQNLESIPERNMSKPDISVLPQQPKVGKTVVDLNAPKNTENRPSTASYIKPDSIKDTNTEQQRDDDTIGEENIYKNNPDDQENQEDDTEAGGVRCDTIQFQF